MNRCLTALLILKIVPFASAALATDGVTSPTETVNIGSRRELFVEDTLIERLVGKAGLRLHHPVPQTVVMKHDKPWEGNGCAYHCIFKDGNLFRMYYAAGALTVTSDGVDAGTHGQVCCYAESDDGVHWRKPELGLHEFEGSKANNIVMVRQKVGDAVSEPGEPAFFKDENPNVSPDAQYKALLPVNRLPDDYRRGLVACKSPDGIHWSLMSEQAVLEDGAFDSQNLAFWDHEHGHYRAYWRYFTKGGFDSKTTWDPQGNRDIRTAISTDFLNWTDQQDLKYTDSPSEQLYTSQVKPYHRAPHVLIGFPMRYIERGHKDAPGHEARAGATPEKIQKWSASLRALPDFQNRQWRAKSSERYGRTITEGLFMASRDGVRFKRWNEGFLRPGIQRPGTWSYGHQSIAWQAIETKGTLEGSPNELSLFAVEGYWTGRSDLLRRYTLRLDGFVSVEAPMSGGELLSKPVIFSGNALWMNFSTSAAGSVLVEIQDEQGNAIPGFTLNDCEELFGDTIERQVQWKSGADLSLLNGQPVKLRFVLRDADVYSYQFRD